MLPAELAYPAFKDSQLCVVRKPAKRAASWDTRAEDAEEKERTALASAGVKMQAMSARDGDNAGSSSLAAQLLYKSQLEQAALMSAGAQIRRIRARAAPANGVKTGYVNFPAADSFDRTSVAPFFGHQKLLDHDSARAPGFSYTPAPMFTPEARENLAAFVMNTTKICTIPPRSSESKLESYVDTEMGVRFLWDKHGFVFSFPERSEKMIYDSGVANSFLRTCSLPAMNLWLEHNSGTKWTDLWPQLAADMVLLGVAVNEVNPWDSGGGNSGHPAGSGQSGALPHLSPKYRDLTVQTFGRVSFMPNFWGVSDISRLPGTHGWIILHWAPHTLNEKGEPIPGSKGHWRLTPYCTRSKLGVHAVASELRGRRNLANPFEAQPECKVFYAGWIEGQEGTSGELQHGANEMRRLLAPKEGPTMLADHTKARQRLGAVRFFLKIDSGRRERLAPAPIIRVL